MQYELLWDGCDKHVGSYNQGKLVENQMIGHDGKLWVVMRIDLHSPDLNCGTAYVVPFIDRKEDLLHVH